MVCSVVTGASSGMGRAVASALAARGERIIAVGRDAGRLASARSANKEAVVHLGKCLALQDSEALDDRSATRELQILAALGPALMIAKGFANSEVGEMLRRANALCEALACSVPTLASWISGSIGLLGVDYPGFFPLKDTKALAAMLERAENDSIFYKKLKKWGDRLKPMVSPANERPSVSCRLA